MLGTLRPCFDGETPFIFGRSAGGFQVYLSVYDIYMFLHKYIIYKHSICIENIYIDRYMRYYMYSIVEFVSQTRQSGDELVLGRCPQEYGKSQV